MQSNVIQCDALYISGIRFCSRWPGKIPFLETASWIKWSATGMISRQKSTFLPTTNGARLKARILKQMHANEFDTICTLQNYNKTHAIRCVCDILKRSKRKLRAAIILWQVYFRATQYSRLVSCVHIYVHIHVDAQNGVPSTSEDGSLQSLHCGDRCFFVNDVHRTWSAPDWFCVTMWTWFKALWLSDYMYTYPLPHSLPLHYKQISGHMQGSIMQPHETQRWIKIV